MPLGRLNITPERTYWAMIGALVSLSLFFGYQVRARRARVKSVVVVESGAVVRAAKAIDGDEVRLKIAGKPLVVRLLGIKSFSAKANERTIQAVGAQAQRALNQLLREEPLTVEFQALKRDRHSRLLAYLSANGRDIGLELVRQGLAMVYTRFPFDRQAPYLAAEQSARKANLGLWSDPNAKVRADSLKAVWEADQ